MEKPSLPESLFTSPEWISEGNLIPRGAALDNRGRRFSPLHRWREPSAPESVVYAKNQGGPASAICLSLGQEQIARSCSIGQATVHRYLERAAAVGLNRPLRSVRRSSY